MKQRRFWAWASLLCFVMPFYTGSFFPLIGERMRNYLEALTRAATVVFEKTGTLTKARLTVKEVVPFGEQSAEALPADRAAFI